MYVLNNHGFIRKHTRDGFHETWNQYVDTCNDIFAIIYMFDNYVDMLYDSNAHFKISMALSRPVYI